MDAQNTISPMPPSAGQPIIISTKKDPSKGFPVQLSTRPAVRTWADVPRNYPRVEDRRDVRHRNYWQEDEPEFLTDADLSAQAESWMAMEDAEAENTGIVFCGNCGSAMHVARAGPRYQMSCGYCGVKGPIDDTSQGARTLARDLFPDK